MSSSEYSNPFSRKNSRCPKTGEDNCECENNKTPDLVGRGKSADSKEIDLYFQKYLTGTGKINFYSFKEEQFSNKTSVDTPGFIPLRYQQPM